MAGRFGYYAGLGRADKATYRQSDAHRAIELPAPAVAELAARATAIREQLEASSAPRAVTKVAAALVRGVTEALAVPPVTVRVLSRRPSNAQAELHGLYEREEGKQAIIRVWMRTAVGRKVVSFRTFLRTLLHELCHHLDYEFLRLRDSFHTEGFFRRESSLMRQLAPAAPRKRKAQQMSLPL